VIVAAVHPDQPVILRGEGLRKAYSHVQALDGVDIEIRAGQITAIVGDNGAGKSTLVKILSGAVRPDAGSIHFLGSEVHLRSPAAARSLGIETVYQDLALAPNRDVVDNLFVGRELCRGGLLAPFKVLDRRRMRQRAAEQLEQLEVGLPRASGLPVDRMSGGQRQAVAIARAVLWASRVMFMDEPTAALGVREAAAALRLAKRVADSGVAVVMISHVMPHVTEFADRVVVLRHGRKVAEVGSGTSTEELVGLIVGSQSGLLPEESS
jgi:simple sugar transport system ATP-binding protein